MSKGAIIFIVSIKTFLLTINGELLIVNNIVRNGSSEITHWNNWYQWRLSHGIFRQPVHEKLKEGKPFTLRMFTFGVIIIKHSLNNYSKWSCGIILLVASKSCLKIASCNKAFPIHWPTLWLLKMYFIDLYLQITYGDFFNHSGPGPWIKSETFSVFAILYFGMTKHKPLATWPAYITSPFRLTFLLVAPPLGGASTTVTDCYDRDI